jgi:hypothetical protein
VSGNDAPSPPDGWIFEIASQYYRFLVFFPLVLPLLAALGFFVRDVPLAASIITFGVSFLVAAVLIVLIGLALTPILLLLQIEKHLRHLRHLAVQEKL